MSSSVHDSITLDESVAFGELPQQIWEDLDDIMLATRSGEWMPSDPEAISRWFNDRALQHTEQLRRACRYAKAWRDHWWSNGGGPTSVALMIAIAQKFVPHPGRDDLAFEKSMRELAYALTQEIREPGIDGGKENFNQLEPHEQADAASKAGDCASAFQRGRMRANHQKEVAIADVRSQLGQRVPRDDTLVDIEAEVEAVLAVRPRTVVAPVVRATSAG